MNFLKNFFDDESKIIGLCGFKTIKQKHKETLPESTFFFNPFQGEKVYVSNFETNFSKNILLI